MSANRGNESDFYNYICMQCGKKTNFVYKYGTLHFCSEQCGDDWDNESPCPCGNRVVKGKYMCRLCLDCGKK